jgi:hypothetical protein
MNTRNGFKNSEIDGKYSGGVEIQGDRLHDQGQSRERRGRVVTERVTGVAGSSLPAMTLLKVANGFRAF